MRLDNLVIVRRGEQATAEESNLKRELGLPLVAAGQAIAVPFALCFIDDRLILYRSRDKPSSGIAVDFNTAAMRRRRQESLKQQGLGKAIGLKAGRRPGVADATAGLGTDAFLLACYGCRVTAWERHPVIAALLRDGLRRAAAHVPGRELANLTLQFGDFRHADVTAGDYDVVYLDPMFPPSRKSARAKKTMTLLQELLGREQDDTELLRRALAVARGRVVVKRARLSPWLDDKAPDLTFPGRSNRYDVYLAANATK